MEQLEEQEAADSPQEVNNQSFFSRIKSYLSNGLSAPAFGDEVIDISNQGETDGQATSPGDSNVLTTHFVVFYDRLLRFREYVSDKLKCKIMKFMRQDIDSGRYDDTTPHDVEGGVSRSINSTYDGLIFKITLFLGLLLRFPLLWSIGSVFFILYANFKPRTIKVRLPPINEWDFSTVWSHSLPPRGSWISTDEGE